MEVDFSQMWSTTHSITEKQRQVIGVPMVKSSSKLTITVPCIPVIECMNQRATHIIQIKSERVNSFVLWLLKNGHF